MNITSSVNRPRPQSPPTPPPKESPVESNDSPFLPMSRSQVDSVSLAVTVGAGLAAACLSEPSQGVLRGAVIGGLIGSTVDYSANLARGVLPEANRYDVWGGGILGVIAGALSGGLGGNPLVTAGVVAGMNQLSTRVLDQVSGQAQKFPQEGYPMWVDGKLIIIPSESH